MPVDLKYQASIEEAVADLRRSESAPPDEYLRSRQAIALQAREAPPAAAAHFRSEWMSALSIQAEREALRFAPRSVAEKAFTLGSAMDPFNRWPFDEDSQRTIKVMHSLEEDLRRRQEDDRRKLAQEIAAQLAPLINKNPPPRTHGSALDEEAQPLKAFARIDAAFPTLAPELINSLSRRGGKTVVIKALCEALPDIPPATVERTFREVMKRRRD